MDRLTIVGDNTPGPVTFKDFLFVIGSAAALIGLCVLIALVNS